MARRVNYGFEKRQRELAKQKKKQERAEKKRMAAEGPEEPQDADAPDGDDAGSEKADQD